MTSIDTLGKNAKLASQSLVQFGTAQKNSVLR